MTVRYVYDDGTERISFVPSDFPLTMTESLIHSNPRLVCVEILGFKPWL